MVKRSLVASQEGIEIAKKALISKKLKQQDLVGIVCYSRQPISKFFNGKTLSTEIFVKICERLNLDWQEIAGLKTAQSSQGRVSNAHLTDNIDKLVIQLRQQVNANIETRCGTMKILDMVQEIDLGKIYTQVNILDKISRRQRKEIAELLKNCNAEDFERFNFGAVTEERIQGKKAVNRHKKTIYLW